MKDDTEKVKQSLLAKKNREIVPSSDLLGTGSTLLNLALSDRTIGGYPKGKYVLLVGDSDSGKSWLAFSAFAEATLREEFDNYRFIYDSPEEGADMDKGYFFGKAVGRLEPPRGTQSEPQHSKTVEEFYDNLEDAQNDGRPFIYVLDSETSLDSKADLKKRQKNRKARENDKDEGGSYGDGKAVFHSRHLRSARNRLGENGSILILISQTRQNIGFGAQFQPKTRSGGEALTFYAHQELWVSQKGNLTTDVKGKKVQQGMTARVKVKRTRLTGKKWTVDIPIYWSSGIDDVGGCVKYLLEWDHWKKDSGRVNAKEFGVKDYEEKLIQKIESEGLERKLRSVVEKVWFEIEAASSVVRKPRYD